ncbi:hypothetical protein LCGC14_2134620 [marine sediment metagenome]|uniref:Uncharacterized protein n=1 Tax=marine sediment metagenome TaxID=412755 RepID=A0A0F9EMI8_9ZZZZ
MPLSLGWFSTGRGPGSRRLLAAVQDEISAGRLDAEIAVVFCNREPGQDPQTDQFFEQVLGRGLPLVWVSDLFAVNNEDGLVHLYPASLTMLGLQGLLQG